MRFLLAVLCLVSAGLMASRYDPTDAMPLTFHAPILAVLLAFLGLGVLSLLRPGPKVYAAALGLGGVLGAILLFAWFLGHVTASSGGSTRGWDAWMLPFIGLQAAIVVVALLAMRSSRDPW